MEVRAAYKFGPLSELWSKASELHITHPESLPDSLEKLQLNFSPLE